MTQSERMVGQLDSNLLQIDRVIVSAVDHATQNWVETLTIEPTSSPIFISSEGLIVAIIAVMAS